MRPKTQVWIELARAIILSNGAILARFQLIPCGILCCDYITFPLHFLSELMDLNIAIVLILLGGWFMGRLFLRLHLPAVLGMLVCGLLIGELFSSGMPGGVREMEPFLKTFALVVILLRAGLSLHRKTLHKVGGVSLRMAFIPCVTEGTVLMMALHYWMGFSWAVAGLTAFMLAAVSPAVVIPAMLNLNQQGYGKARDVPTIVLAGASVDDVLAITLFSLFLGIAVSGEAISAWSFLALPRSILIGILPGIVVGYILSVWFLRRYHAVRATEKVLIVLMISVLLVQAGDWFHSAALLGIMTMGFILLERVEHIAHELSAKLSKIWVFAEIILFVMIGIALDLRVAIQVAPSVIGILIVGLFARSAGVWLATMRSNLTAKERVFCVLAYLPKATVQAALGGVPLAAGVAGGDVILAMAVLSIAITAPLGLVGIRWAGPRLLNISFPEETEETS